MSSANRSLSCSASSSHSQVRTNLSKMTACLESLLAHFNSFPSSNQDQLSSQKLNHHNQSTHSYLTQPPTSVQVNSQLEPTAGPDSNIPPTSSELHPLSRFTNPINRSLSKTSNNPTVLNAWQYLPFLTKQATNIASSFVSHHFNGPPKKSWGIEMTIFTAIVRDMANFTHLSSIHQLRSLMDLGQILPMPKDGIITPVSFKVKRHNLTGFLKELDESEDGTRVLTGEWVLSKKTWKRMQTESLARRSKNQAHNFDYGFGDSSHSSTTLDPNHEHNLHGLGQDKVIYYIHGGAYFIMSASTHRPLTISIAKYTECRLFAINYRLAPETKFPGPLHDVVAGYFRLLNDLGIPPQNIVLSGDSAGGGLAIALLMYLRDEKYPLPSAAMLFSPWCDLTMSCDSWVTNQPYDFLPMPKPDDALNPIRCYLGEDGVKKWITHPYVSPLFGNMHGLPPLLIQAGDAEVLRDEITLLAHKASLHDVEVIHEIYEDCVHVFQAFLFLESSTKALQSMRNYIRHLLPKIETQRHHTSEGQTAYQPRPSSVDSYDQQFNDVNDPNQGAVDREISRDAHLVDEMSQTVEQSLPPTPAVPNLDGSEAQDNYDSEEVLSASEDPEEDDDLTSIFAQAEPFKDLKSTKLKGSVSETLTASSSNLKRSPSNASLSRHTNRSSAPSLRGRLPPAMDLETIKKLILFTPRHEIPFDFVNEPSPAHLKDDVDTKSSQSNLNLPRCASLQTATMAINSSHGSTSSNSGSQSPISSQHIRRHSNNYNSLRPSQSRKFTTSNVALLTPMMRNQDSRSPALNVDEDVQAMVQDLISTPSQLKTTVYSQGEEEDSEIEYFKGIRDTKTSISTTSSLDEHHTLNFSKITTNHDSTSRDSISSGSDTSMTKLSLEDDKVDETETSPEFAFQTPGYGFS